MKHKWRMADGVPDDWAWESGYHNGVYCERCGARICVHCRPDWEEMDDCEAVESNPQTNADRIRAMSDEELATDLLDMFGEIFEDGVPSKEWMLMWLRHPAGVGE